MISFFWIIAFLTLLSLTALILWALIWWLRRSGADRRSPLTRNLLRNPGDSLRPQLEELALDMLGLSCLLLIIPIVVYSMWITELHFGTTRVTKDWPRSSRPREAGRIHEPDHTLRLARAVARVRGQPPSQ